ncbi:flagellar basal-body rod protein FlgG [Thalassoglobus polymorphus]|uniref:Flagellar basal-body rod protein FlgG n=1 Tax=Thalassoglobus polymorphus TaxID=2527994 RepID=A0A517QPN5_9PLAN|nr:flagellar basal-body rod protein FlgG [Thalassoglobus polymorphus]QDT33581.1 Flagellar basal-body rod protein FlgG [Thalassoglobus polymorphus]
MLRGLYTSAIGMKAQELLLDNTANNLANVNTTGFKRSHLDFADLLYSTLQQPGTEVAAGQVAPTGLQIGSGVRATGTTKVFTPGTFEQTGNSLDVAIEGDGFFKVQLPNGEVRYTRDGAFRLDNNGQLVTTNGYLLDAGITVQDGISITKLNIGEDGTVSGVLEGSPQSAVQLGQLQLARFLNPAGLSSEGGNLYAATPASGNEVLSNPGDEGVGILRQGFLEGSNVEVVTELISLISAQRAYEINSRAIRAGDEMLSTTSDIVR